MIDVVIIHECSKTIWNTKVWSRFEYASFALNGVDGRTPKQPPGMSKSHVNSEINYLPTDAGFLPSTASLVIA